MVPKSLCFLAESSELLGVVTTSFVDGGRFRGVLVGHKRLSSLEVAPPEGEKPSLEDDFIAAVKCCKFCVEWAEPPVPVPRWRVLPNMPDNPIKRRKWYHGLTFFTQHPLAVRSYISSLANREYKIEKELEVEEKKQQAKEAIKKRAKLIGAHKKKKTDKGDIPEETASVVVLGPVTRSDARCYPPMVDIPKDMLILRKAEERPFLDDWQYEVFTPESLTDISTTMGRTSNAASLEWFHQELTHLRALKVSKTELTAPTAHDVPGRWAE